MRSARVLLGSAVLATAALTMSAPAAFAAGDNGNSNSSSSASVDGGDHRGVVTVPACNAVSSKGSSVFTCLPGATAVF
ncbi:hypothetical protein [Streptomyces ureilyticus]|uniref:Chaplin domain-containing protein n=1 Tax=Streptomyces ureilyticus TaxID=1775131 RepID=A0ABX0DXC2_9ACTN|nr:hypothetical protein [Streptomyces ureilyticus]NGO46586.1 hypothetical protein [Streptomyces ureilyticus]